MIVLRKIDTYYIMGQSMSREGALVAQQKKNLRSVGYQKASGGVSPDQCKRNAEERLANAKALQKASKTRKKKGSGEGSGFTMPMSAAVNISKTVQERQAWIQRKQDSLMNPLSAALSAETGLRKQLPKKEEVWGEKGPGDRQVTEEFFTMWVK